MCRPFWPHILFLVSLIFLLPAGPGLASETTGADVNLQKQRPPQEDEESILDLTFGSPPELATERGILIIDAFEDSNGDGRRDPDEKDLNNQVVCTLDGIDYQVPAFIPGLPYQETFQLSCSSDIWLPRLTRNQIFVSQRGQVIHLDLPCTRKN
ncbi:MAG: hypothetical protein D6794_08825 [Deltaproteobacteria bacterium]|nr:MAG: hypothetical protein D6794_08825 [Deltaproteobacteria bacterium]